MSIDMTKYIEEQIRDDIAERLTAGIPVPSKYFVHPETFGGMTKRLNSKIVACVTLSAHGSSVDVYPDPDAIRDAIGACWSADPGAGPVPSIAASTVASLEVGAIVQLKSGGPRMTITARAGDVAECTWFTPGLSGESRVRLPVAALRAP